MLPYGRPLRRLRSAFHRGMGASVIHPYRPIQHEEVKRHLLRMFDNPKDFGESGRKCVFRLTRTRSRPTFTIACLLQRPIVIRMIGAMIMRIVYGLDVPLLPYTTALVKECLRWRNVTPLGFPHTVREDDEYKGYFIPKGSTILPITWQVKSDCLICLER